MIQDRTKETRLSSFPLLVILLIPINLFGADFGLSTLVFFCVCAFFLFIGLTNHFGNANGVTFGKNVLITILMVIVMAANLRENSVTTVSYWIGWIISIAIIALAKKLLFDMQKASWLIIIVAIFCMLVVLFSKLLPAAYIQLVSRYMPPEILAYNYLSVFGGYSGAIGNSIANTCYCLAAGVGVLMSNADSGRKSKLWALGVAMLIVALLLTGRRGETIACIAAAALLYCWGGGSGKRARRIAMLVGILGVAVLVVFIFWDDLISLPILSRYAKMVQRIESGADITSGRSQLYKVAWKLFLEHPVFGIGWQNFAHYVPYNLSSLRSVHCVYLQFLCETGIVGTVLIMWLILYNYIYCIKTLNKVRDRAPSGKGERMDLFGIRFAFFMQTFFLAVGIVDNPVYKLQYCIWFAIINIFVMQDTERQLQSEQGMMSGVWENDIGRQTT